MESERGQKLRKLCQQANELYLEKARLKRCAAAPSRGQGSMAAQLKSISLRVHRCNRSMVKCYKKLLGRDERLIEPIIELLMLYMSELNAVTIEEKRREITEAADNESEGLHRELEELLRDQSRLQIIQDNPGHVGRVSIRREVLEQVSNFRD